MSEPKYTFEVVWQALMESREQMKERAAEEDKKSAEFREQMKEASAEFREQMKQLSVEADKRSAEADRRSAEEDSKAAEFREQMKESSAEFRKQMKEMSTETDRRLKELSRNLAGISDSNGKMAEQAIYNTLERDMKFAGIDFYDIAKNMHKKIKSLNMEAEFDIVLTNCSIIALIETKYQVQKKDVIKLVTKQVGNFRKLFKEYANYKIVLGVGGSSFDTDAEQEAEDNGVGIIKIINDKVEYFTDNIRIY